MSAYDIRVEIYSGNGECIVFTKFVFFNPLTSVCEREMKNTSDS